MLPGSCALGEGSLHHVLMKWILGRCSSGKGVASRAFCRETSLDAFWGGAGRVWLLPGVVKHPRAGTRVQKKSSASRVAGQKGEAQI